MLCLKSVDGPLWDDYPESAWTIKSKALVASDGHDGVVLETGGPIIRFDIEEAGLHCLSDLGLDAAPKGLSVWEGRADEAGPIGIFRPLTAPEWVSLQCGLPLWNDEEWRKP